MAGAKCKSFKEVKRTDSTRMEEKSMARQAHLATSLQLQRLNKNERL